MANGFLRGGMMPKSSSGRGRGAFMNKSSSNMPTPPHMPSPHSGMEKPEHQAGSGSETKIVHHPDGSHEVHHSDGETSKHPSAGHMAAHIHAKHAGGGNVGNMQCDDMGKCTTNHVGPDGEVSGPTEHGVPQEGADHLANMMSGGMDTEASEPDGDEYSGLAG